MNGIRKYALGLTFIACFLAVGIPYWRIPYQAVNLPNALFAPGLIAVALAACLSCLRRIDKFGRVTLIIGAPVPSAVMTRVLVEGLRDPTSHNLWPLEVVIAAFVGFGCSLAGAIVGSVIATLLRAPKQAGPS